MPAQQDYPDYMRVNQEVGNPFVDDAAVFNGPGSRTYGPFFSAPWESITITANSLASPNPIVVDVFWTVDQAGTQVIGHQRGSCNGGSVFADQFAVLGPYCSITIGWGVLDGAASTFLYVLPRRAMHGWARSIDDAKIASGAATAVGAGLTVTFDPLIVTSGRAHFHAASAAATWDAGVSTLDTGGVVDGTLASCYSTAIALVQDVDLFLPPRQLRITLRNTSGAGTTFAWSLVVDTSW